MAALSPPPVVDLAEADPLSMILEPADTLATSHSLSDPNTESNSKSAESKTEATTKANDENTTANTESKTEKEVEEVHEIDWDEDDTYDSELTSTNDNTSITDHRTDTSSELHQNHNNHQGTNQDMSPYDDIDTTIGDIDVDPDDDQDNSHEYLDNPLEETSTTIDNDLTDNSLDSETIDFEVTDNQKNIDMERTATSDAANTEDTEIVEKLHTSVDERTDTADIETTESETRNNHEATERVPVHQDPPRGNLPDVANIDSHDAEHASTDATSFHSPHGSAGQSELERTKSIGNMEDTHIKSSDNLDVVGDEGADAPDEVIEDALEDSVKFAGVDPTRAEGESEPVDPTLDQPIDQNTVESTTNDQLRVSETTSYQETGEDYDEMYEIVDMEGSEDVGEVEAEAEAETETEAVTKVKDRGEDEVEAEGDEFDGQENSEDDHDDVDVVDDIEIKDDMGDINDKMEDDGDVGDVSDIDVDEEVADEDDERAHALRHSTHAQFPGIMLVYRGFENPLYQGQPNLDPEVGFFSSAEDVLDMSMDHLLSQFRASVEEDLERYEELVFQIDEMGLEYAESTRLELVTNVTLRQILEIYVQLITNDSRATGDAREDGDSTSDSTRVGSIDVSQYILYTRLLVRPSANARLNYLIDEAFNGSLLHDIAYHFPQDSPESSDRQSDVNIDDMAESVGETTVGFDHNDHTERGDDRDGTEKSYDIEAKATEVDKGGQKEGHDTDDVHGLDTISTLENQEKHTLATEESLETQDREGQDSGDQDEIQDNYESDQETSGSEGRLESPAESRSEDHIDGQTGGQSYGDQREEYEFVDEAVGEAAHEVEESYREYDQYDSSTERTGQDGSDQLENQYDRDTDQSAKLASANETTAQNSDKTGLQDEMEAPDNTETRQPNSSNAITQTLATPHPEEQAEENQDPDDGHDGQRDHQIDYDIDYDNYLDTQTLVDEDDFHDVDVLDDTLDDGGHVADPPIPHIFRSPLDGTEADDEDYLEETLTYVDDEGGSTIAASSYLGADDLDDDENDDDDDVGDGVDDAERTPEADTDLFDKKYKEKEDDDEGADVDHDSDDMASLPRSGTPDTLVNVETETIVGLADVQGWEGHESDSGSSATLQGDPTEDRDDVGDETIDTGDDRREAADAEHITNDVRSPGSEISWNDSPSKEHGKRTRPDDVDETEQDTKRLRSHR